MKPRAKHPKTQTREQPEGLEGPPQPPAPTPEQIQARAYEIYEARGGAPGHDWDDWLLAEQELTSGLGARRNSAE